MSKVATGRGGGLVTPAAPCRCHRRLRRARELGRVASGVTATKGSLDVAALRQKLAHVDEAIRAARAPLPRARLRVPRRVGLEHFRSCDPSRTCRLFAHSVTALFTAPPMCG
jgi:hypothetical protein